jgi:hypothetical protein
VFYFSYISVQNTFHFDEYLVCDMCRNTRKPSFKVAVKPVWSKCKWQFFIKLPNIKFHENLSSASQVVSCNIQTDGRTVKTLQAFCSVANAPKQAHELTTNCTIYAWVIKNKNILYFRQWTMPHIIPDIFCTW